MISLLSSVSIFINPTQSDVQLLVNDRFQRRSSDSKSPDRSLDSLLPFIPKSLRQYPVPAQGWWMSVFLRSAHIRVNIRCSLYGNVVYQSALTSTAISSMICSSSWDDLWDGNYVAVQIPFCWVLLPGFIQNSMQDPCVIPTYRFVKIQKLSGHMEVRPGR